MIEKYRVYVVLKRYIILVYYEDKFQEVDRKIKSLWEGFLPLHHKALVTYRTCYSGYNIRILSYKEQKDFIRFRKEIRLAILERNTLYNSYLKEINKLVGIYK